MLSTVVWCVIPQIRKWSTSQINDASHMDPCRYWKCLYSRLCPKYNYFVKSNKPLLLFSRKICLWVRFPMLMFLLLWSKFASIDISCCCCCCCCTCHCLFYCCCGWCRCCCCSCCCCCCYRRCHCCCCCCCCWPICKIKMIFKLDSINKIWLLTLFQIERWLIFCPLETKPTTSFQATWISACRTFYP